MESDMHHTGRHHTTQIELFYVTSHSKNWFIRTLALVVAVCVVLFHFLSATMYAPYMVAELHHIWHYIHHETEDRLHHTPGESNPDLCHILVT